MLLHCIIIASSIRLISLCLRNAAINVPLSDGASCAIVNKYVALQTLPQYISSLGYS